MTREVNFVGFHTFSIIKIELRKLRGSNFSRLKSGGQEFLSTNKVYSWIFSGSKPYGNNVGLEYFSSAMTFVCIVFLLLCLMLYV